MSGQVVWHGAKAKAAMRAGAARGLALGAEHILEESNRIVPIEEGTLGRSGSTDVDSDALQATISFDTPYAVVQHEDLTLNHDAGRQGKYLETPLKSRGDAAMKIVGDNIREAIQ